MSAKQLLIPAKFITLLLQLILTLVIYESKYENILGYSDSTAENNVTAGVTLSVIVLCLELIILFLGFTQDFEKATMVQIVMHSLGTVLVAWFILDVWKYDLIWLIWTFCCLFPFTLDLLSIVGALVFHRAIISVKE